MNFWDEVKDDVMNVLGYLGIFLEIGAAVSWGIMWIKILLDKIDDLY